MEDDSIISEANEAKLAFVGLRLKSSGKGEGAACC